MSGIVLSIRCTVNLSHEAGAVKEGVNELAGGAEVYPISGTGKKQQLAIFPS
jgi:hypothetical protein